MAVSNTETKQPEGSRRRKPAITRRVVSANESDGESQCGASSVRKSGQARRIVSTTESDTDDSLPDSFIKRPSTSQTPIDKAKAERPRVNSSVLPTLTEPTKKGFVRPSSNVDVNSLGFGSERAIQALTGLKDGFVFQLKKKVEVEEEEEGSTKDGADVAECNGSLIDGTLNGDIPEGTVIVQPEAASDGENDWYRSKEFKKQFTRERRERREAKDQNSSASNTESVFCTACTSQMNPFDKRTLFCHSVLSVIICKRCNEFYNSGPWKLDSDGIEEQCRWCGEGGNLTCCDYCPRTFCKPCITRNLGRGEWSRISSQKEWQCYVCEPSPLTVLVAKCSALLSKFDKFGRIKKERQERELNRETEREKDRVGGKKKSTVAAKLAMKKARISQDSAIAEEFQQYLVGNITNKALFMRSLVHLKKEVPSMQKLQMNLALKHIGEVKSVLTELEGCVNQKLNGDVNKSDSALDGTDPEDCDSPERRSKMDVMTPGEMDGSGRKEIDAEGTNRQQALDMSAESDEHRSEELDITITQEEGCVPDAVPENGEFEVGNDTEDMDIEESSLPNVEENGQNETEAEKKESHSIEDDDDMRDDCEKEHMAEEKEHSKRKCVQKEVENEHDDGEEKDQSCRDQAVEEEDKVIKCETGIKLKPCKVSVASIKAEKLGVCSDGADEKTVDSHRDIDSDDDNMPSSQHSARKLKVTPKSPRSRSSVSAQSPEKSFNKDDEEDDEAKLMSLIDGWDEESSDGSEGSSYDPRKPNGSSKKSPHKARRELSLEKKKSSGRVKEEPASGPDSDAEEEEEVADKKRGPGEDSSNVEGESGFDGIPGESSVDSQDSQDEAGEEKKTRALRKNKENRMESDEGLSDKSSIEENTRSSHQRRQANSRKRLSRKRNRSASDGSDSMSEDEKDMKRLERISLLKRKRKQGDEGEDEHDGEVNIAEDRPDNGKKETVGNDCSSGKEASDKEEEMEVEKESKKIKKEKKSPAKVEAKSKEFLSSDSSVSEESDDCQSDDTSGLRWRSLNKKGKKKKEGDR